MGKIKDITNKKFGKLTVLEIVGKKDGKCYYWKCQCDCGNIIEVNGVSLRSGNTKSCGCGKYDGLKKYNAQQTLETKIPNGTRFGKLVVIEDLGYKPQYKNSPKNRQWYKCQCDCGNVCEAHGNALKTNNKISCGSCLISKGEYIIKTLLDKNNIIYKQEVDFPELTKISGHRYRFDFVIYNNDNTIKRIIEYDGRQHVFGPDTNYWSRASETLEDIQKRDKEKNDFCLKNHFPLVRIPYTKLNCTLEDLFGDKYLIKGE